MKTGTTWRILYVIYLLYVETASFPNTIHYITRLKHSEGRGLQWSCKFDPSCQYVIYELQQVHSKVWRLWRTPWRPWSSLFSPATRGLSPLCASCSLDSCFYGTVWMWQYEWPRNVTWLMWSGELPGFRWPLLQIFEDLKTVVDNDKEPWIHSYKQAAVITAVILQPC